MRKTIYIAIMFTLMVSAGCEDYLGIKPRGYDVAYKIEHYEGLIYGAEPFMLDETFPYMCFEYTTDRDGYESVYSNLGSSAVNAYMWEADIYRPDENSGEWNYHTSMLYPMNVIIGEVMDAQGGTEQERLALQAEARVLRAWNTFQMAQFFGRHYDPATASSDLCVPIITTASTLGNDFPRKSVAEVYGFITDEMEKSIPALPTEQDHCRRAFGVTANAMLGKVLWNMGEYGKALIPLGNAMDGLSAVGAGLLDYNVIVEADGNINYPVDELKNPELLYNQMLMPCLWLSMMPSYYGTIMLALKTDVLKRYYAADDLRLCFISGLKSGKPASKSFGNDEIYHTNMNRITSDIGMTVADLYLMYAECLAREGSLDDARDVVERFRAFRMPAASAGVPSEVVSAEDLIRFIVDERMREYIGFGNTWFDMKRLWNDPLFEYMKPMYTHTDGTDTWTLTQKRLTFRIPPSVLAWHPEYTDNE